MSAAFNTGDRVRVAEVETVCAYLHGLTGTVGSRVSFDFPRRVGKGWGEPPRLFHVDLDQPAQAGPSQAKVKRIGLRADQLTRA